MKPSIALLVIASISTIPSYSYAKIGRFTNSTWINRIYNNSSEDIYYGDESLTVTNKHLTKANTNENYDWPTPSIGIQYLYDKDRNVKYTVVDNISILNALGIKDGAVSLIKWQDQKPYSTVGCYRIEVNWSGDFGYDLVYNGDNTIINNFDPKATLIEGNGDLDCVDNFNRAKEHIPD